MGFFVTLFLWIGSTLIERKLRSRALSSTRPQPFSHAGSPTSIEGTPVTAVFGKALISSPQVIGHPQQRTEPIRTDAGIVGYKYFNTIAWGISLGLDSIEEVRFDDKPCPFTREVLSDRHRLTFNAPTFFGEEGGVPNGVVGQMDVYFGTTTQAPSAFLAAKAGHNVPAHRRFAYAVALDLYIGNSATVPPVSFVGTKYPTSLSVPAATRIIGEDLNPACLLYEVLTNTTWSVKWPTVELDTASFQAAATTLKNEGLGLTLVLDEPSEANDFVLAVLRHIDAVLVPDAASGKHKLTLIRPDYSVGSLPVLDADMVHDVTLRRTGLASTANIVRVRYTDRAANFESKTVQLQDLANVQARSGERAMEEFDFPGITTKATAQMVCARELRVAAYDLAVVSFTCDRNAWAFSVGSVFRLAYAPLGLSIICRVTSIATGTVDDGAITIDAVEDIFGVQWTAFSPPAASGWVDPLGVPGPISAFMCEAAPLPFTGSTNADDLEKVVFITPDAVGARTDGYVVRTAGGIELDRIPPATSGLIVDASIRRDSSSLVFNNCPDTMGSLAGTIADWPFRRGLRLVAIPANAQFPTFDDPAWSRPRREWIAFKTLVWDPVLKRATISGLARGVLDTCPGDLGTSYPYGTPFLNSSVCPFFSGVEFPFRSPFSPRGELDAATGFYGFGPGGERTPFSSSAFGDTTRRTPRPWLPTEIVCTTTGSSNNGGTYPGVVTLIWSWEHRNRFDPGFYQTSHRAPLGAIESGVVYRVRFFTWEPPGFLSGVLLRTVDDITGLSVSYTAGQRASDNGGAQPSGITCVIDAHFSGDTSLDACSWHQFVQTVVKA